MPFLSDKPNFRLNLEPYQKQEIVLHSLLRKAKNTEFGKFYDFEGLLNSEKCSENFSNLVPVFNYDTMFDNWWHRTLKEEANITWPGKIKFFALSSGTSGTPSKRIPVSADMMKSMKRFGLKQTLVLPKYRVPLSLIQKKILIMGGCTELNQVNNHFEGDLSGILASNFPKWFYKFYKPGPQIATIRDWNKKIDKIVEQASKWDMGIVTGVPSWIQILFERMIAHYQVDNILQIWPNLKVYVHGGVAFDPFVAKMKKLVGKDLLYLDTYMASEGFIAFQHKLNTPNRAMQLELKAGIYMEFLPFNDENFSADGDLLSLNPKTLKINEVKEGVNYALLVSTNAGTWRYLIGDTIKFTSVENSEIIITGRTKHFLSLVGEHLSVDNMTQALMKTAAEFNVSIPEFLVSGVSYESFFAHHWYLGSKDEIDKNAFKVRLDYYLCQLNDDYATERQSALKEVLIDVVDPDLFYKWMEKRGKLGAQNKCPRVIKNVQLLDWQLFVEQNK